MGSWGMEALESDEGLDLINWVEEQLQDDSTFDAESIVQRLSQHEDLFGFQGDEEFLYDNNVIGLVELIIQKAAGEKSHRVNKLINSTVIGSRRFSAKNSRAVYKQSTTHMSG
ncbi:hypothetical protein ACNF08_06020 [Escherichia coli]|uniref:hypothetical protein n=1 Tax=Escherichia coli TaxID=562 RepID=UPI000AB6CA23|nr:hypothetical protein [Escherichia coli]MCX2354710.1 hypothetical protein [Escherichia coli]